MGWILSEAVKNDYFEWYYWGPSDFPPTAMSRGMGGGSLNPASQSLVGGSLFWDEMAARSNEALCFLIHVWKEKWGVFQSNKPFLSFHWLNWLKPPISEPIQGKGRGNTKIRSTSGRGVSLCCHCNGWDRLNYNTLYKGLPGKCTKSVSPACVSQWLSSNCYLLLCT